ncbi:MAG: hypothetical protein EOP04_18435 [Proteobacteria bacterium]|nr:MAG: hypothetical protein EOP04_18435 [Pseudomonadota bacterium]
MQGRNEPSRWGSETDVGLGAENKVITGPTPSPKKTIDQIKVEKKEKADNQSGSEDSPLHEDNKTHGP